MVSRRADDGVLVGANAARTSTPRGCLVELMEREDERSDAEPLEALG